ncbi:hypothetical protein DFJ73DRAFT_215110 [Zopfochytrium polystomum]|nr:hypothetical protein DFJ73DRAFT_215110 [Zopfochytrium polystomum]
MTLPSDFSTNCCNLASFSSIITCQGNNIISLNLSSTGISGQTPISILKLTALQTLDISYNPKIVGDFKSISALPSLKTFIASGDSGVTGSVVSFPSTVTDCRFDGTGLCGNPGTCQTKVTPLAACANSTTGGGQPYDLIPLTPGIPLYICLGAFALMLSIFSLMCCFCSQRGRVARLEQSGEATRANKKLVQRDYAEPSDTEMSMITLSRNGPPPRSYSLPESREGLSKEAAELDVKAREPFLEANTPPGADEFPGGHGCSSACVP